MQSKRNKLGKNSKTPILTKFKNSTCVKTQKIKW